MRGTEGGALDAQFRVCSGSCSCGRAEARHRERRDMHATTKDAEMRLACSVVSATWPSILGHFFLLFLLRAMTMMNHGERMLDASAAVTAM